VNIGSPFFNKNDQLFIRSIKSGHKFFSITFRNKEKKIK
jgi:hypothetical protein